MDQCEETRNVSSNLAANEIRWTDHIRTKRDGAQFFFYLGTFLIQAPVEALFWAASLDPGSCGTL